LGSSEKEKGNTHYRPELPSSNRGHKKERHWMMFAMDNKFADYMDVV